MPKRPDRSCPPVAPVATVSAMTHTPAIVLLLLGLAAAVNGSEPAAADKVLSKENYTDIKQVVATLRGKMFRHPVPVYNVSPKELRAIADRDLEKDFPGGELRGYAELLAWLDLVPPRTDLKQVYGDYLVGQVAGLYDSESKEMCIPASAAGTTNAARKAAEKKLEGLSQEMDAIVLAHEFTHALEDQYWPLDDPRDHDRSVSTDRGTAHSFLAEGSATREMIEALPAQLGRGSATLYFSLWNLIHSGGGEWALNHKLSGAWKSPDALVPGVPDALARSEAMPYSFGYSFCTKVMRQWGLDGLDYIYNHPPVSSAQVMHPAKAWEWRDLPVQINLPQTLPGGWKQISSDSVGEAGLAVLFGCQFNGLNHALGLVRGWDGDLVALYEGPAGRRLLLWASAWHSSAAAARYAGACVQERQLTHQAKVVGQGGNGIDWQSPDGRRGHLQQEGNRILLLETDSPEGLPATELIAKAITFMEPPEDAVRSAANSPLRRFNPLWASQRDGDYAVKRSLGGLLSRHDRNSVGAADTFLAGILGETRRTTSFRKWQVGAGFLAKHESEHRRGTTKTTVLPWGVLASHEAARVPQAPDKTIARTSVLWGIGASAQTDEAGTESLRVLPFGLLLSRTAGSERSATYILGTGVSHRQPTAHSGASSTVRLLGLPLWTTHAPASKGT
jgi:hypothetical protein